MTTQTESRAPAPLAVDLDGTLIRGDIFFESILAYVAAAPWRALLIFMWLMRGRAYAKAQLAERASPSPADLPYDERVLAWLREQRAKGRTIVLATACDIAAAEAVARHVGLFDAVYASDGRTNLKAARKAERLARAFPEGFVYAGNEAADLHVWRAAKQAVLVNAGRGLARRARDIASIERTFEPEGNSWAALLEAMRPRQWAKNVLVFLPILVGQGWSDGPGLLKGWLAFFALCLAASSLYLVNDAFDIAADRKHPRKRQRPFARGALSPAKGLAAAVLMGAAGLGLAALANVFVFAGAYMVMSAAYTLWLKRKVMADVFVLAALYAVRVVLGAEATDYAASSWMVAFCGFFFLSLALVKRVTELDVASAAGTGQPKRRGYLLQDGSILKTMGVASAFVSSLVLALYVQSDVASAHYGAPVFLWALPGASIFWLCRVWLLTERGAMHDDPVVFAFRDNVSLMVGVMTGLAFMLAVLGPAGVVAFIGGAN